MKKILAILLTTIMCVSCSDNQGSVTSASSLESVLEKNISWPYQVSGVLDIVETGGYEDSEFPSWAVGSVVTADDPDGVMITIGEGILEQAKIDIGSGGTVRVWLGSPKKEFGALMYPVEKIVAE